MVGAIAIPPFFGGSRAGAESHSFSLPFPFAGQRHYQAMQPALGKVPAVVLELQLCCREWLGPRLTPAIVTEGFALGRFALPYLISG